MRSSGFNIAAIGIGMALLSGSAVAQVLPQGGSTPPVPGNPAPDTTTNAAGQPEIATQPADNQSGLGDIVVTARKVSENLQNVPIAVTAFSGAALAQQSARAVPDIALLTPGLNFSPAATTPTAPLITIRGQVQQDTLATLDPSVGIYVDGVYWARAYGLNASLLDVADVQTLKGPQGTLFGRNTTGGAILLNTNDPNFRDGLSGTVTGTYGNLNYMAGTAVLNAPLIDDKLAIRLAFSGNRRDGYVREINSGTKLNDLNDTTFRAKVLVNPTENFHLLLSGELFRTSTYANPQRMTYFSPTGPAVLEAGVETLGAGCFSLTGAPTPACIAAGSNRLNNAIAANQRDKDTVSLSVLPESYARTRTFSATGTLDTSFGAIKAIGAYRQVRSFALSDNDGSDVRILDGIPYNDDARLKQWSGELTATGKAFDDRLDFVLGGFYFKESGTDGSYTATFPALSAVSPATGFQPVYTLYAARINNESEGVYGQATYHFTDRLSFTGGLRYSSDKKGITSSNALLIGTTVICQQPTCPYTQSKRFDGVSYTAALDYKVTDDVLVYAKTSKGFRSGGQNLRGVALLPESLLPFKPEVAYAQEVGLKSELFDRRLRFNIAGYYTEVKDIQRSTAVVVGQSTATVLSNAGKVRVYGFEAEASALLPADFRIDATVGYTNSKYVTYVDFNGFDRSHEPLYLTPRWTASISPSWSHALDFGRLSVRGDFAYQSRMALYPTGFYTDANGVIRDANNGNPTSAADAAGFTAANTDRAHWLINARANLTILDGNLDIAIWGRNLSNQRDIVGGLPIVGVGSAAAIYRDPRTYGTTVTVKF